MIQAFRDKIQSWVSYVIIGLLIIAFGFWGIERLLGVGGGPSNTIAKVDGQEISEAQFSRTYERMKRELTAAMGRSFKYNPVIEKQLKNAAMESLINDILIQKIAALQGYRVTPEQLESVMLTIPQFQDNGRFSQEKFAQVLDQLLFTPTAFMEDLKNKMLYEQMQSVFLSTAFALPNNLKNAYALLQQKRDVKYIMIPLSKFASQINISKEQIKDYYQAHQDQFKTPEEVSIHYVMLDLADIKKNIKPTDTQLKNYYQENLDNFTVSKKWRFAQILVRGPQIPDQEKSVQQTLKNLQADLKQGMSFKDAVKKYSEDLASKKREGLMPWVSLDMVDDNIADALQDLDKGEVSEPIKTPYGYMLIKVVDIQNEKVKPFETVEAIVKNMYVDEKAQKVFAEESERLGNITYADPDSLKQAAETLTLRIYETGFFAREGGKDKILQDPKVVEAAFSADVLGNRYNSDVITLGPDKVMVLRVHQYKKAETKTLEQAAAEIKQILIHNQASLLAKNTGEKIIANLKNGNNLAALAKEQGLTVTSKQNIARLDKDINSGLLQAIFTATPSQINKGQGIVLPSGDYLVLVVDKITEKKLNTADAKDYTEFKEKMANLYGSVDFNLYLDQLKKDAAIKLEQNVQESQ